MKNPTENAIYFVIGALFALAIVLSSWYALRPVDFADPPDVVALPDPDPSPVSPPPPEAEGFPDILLSCNDETAPLLILITEIEEELVGTRNHLAVHHAGVRNLRSWLAARDEDNKRLHLEIGAVCYGVDP